MKVILSLTILIFAAVAFGASFSNEETDLNLPKKWDYIIVGAGTAGSILARRLSEDPTVSVLLLEVGQNYTNEPAVYDPTKSNDQTNSIMRDYVPIEKDAGANNRRLLAPMARMFGGGAAANGLGLERGGAYIWDQMATEINDPSFGYTQLNTYYDKVKSLIGFQPSPTGPLRGIWASAAADMNSNVYEDLNTNDNCCFGFEPLSIKNGRRSFPGIDYLDTEVLSRPNLKIVLGAKVVRLVTDITAKGVKEVEGVSVLMRTRYPNVPQTVEFKARKDVILSAGSLYSPHILMHSGIGDQAVLDANDIPVFHNIPAVGKNLRDNALIVMTYSANITSAQTNGTKPVAFLRSSPNATNPDAFYVVRGGTNSFVVLLWLSGFKSKGVVSLHSGNVVQPPKVETNYFSDPTDMQTFFGAIQSIRTVMTQTPTFQNLKTTETSPAASLSEAWIKANVGSGPHYTSTCRMGPYGASTNDAVVTPDFRVIGVEGLRVVDASVFAESLTSGTYLPTMILAEKAADVIKQSA